MPYPERRAHHLRGVKREHHSREAERLRDKRKDERRRRRGRRRRGGPFKLLRHAAKLTAIKRLLKHRKRRNATGRAATAGGHRIRLHHHLRHFRHARLRHHRLRHHQLRHPRPLHHNTAHPRVGRRTPQSRATGRFAVMQTNFGQNILAPVRGPAYRTGNTTRVGRRQPRRRH